LGAPSGVSGTAGSFVFPRDRAWDERGEGAAGPTVGSLIDVSSRRDSARALSPLRIIA
jgi:hypothetical protein